MGKYGIPMEAKKSPPMGKKMSVEVEIEKEPMGEMSPEESDLMEMAGEMDDAEEESFGAMAPTGDFSAPGLNALVDGLNAVLPLFGIDDYPRFSEGMQTLPARFVKQLTMVMEAASAAGLDDMVIDLGSIVDDRSLKMAAGKLRALAGSTDFKRYIRSERPEEAPTAPAPGGLPELPMAVAAKESGMSEDDLMMSRLR